MRYSHTLHLTTSMIKLMWEVIVFSIAMGIQGFFSIKKEFLMIESSFLNNLPYRLKLNKCI